MIGRWLVMALAITGSASPAAAFNYNGMQSGMSVEQVRQAAAAGGQMPLTAVTNRDDMFTLGPVYTSTVSMQFCNDQLFGINVRIAGGLDAFAEMTAQLVAQYGNPTVAGMHDYTDSGLLSSVRMTWATAAGEETSVDMTGFRGGSGVNRGYSAFEALCRK
jgi:hypothetical protein